jgi:hypothetical protein
VRAAGLASLRRKGGLLSFGNSMRRTYARQSVALTRWETRHVFLQRPA